MTIQNAIIIPSHFITIHFREILHSLAVSLTVRRFCSWMQAHNVRVVGCVGVCMCMTIQKCIRHATRPTWLFVLIFAQIINQVNVESNNAKIRWTQSFDWLKFEISKFSFDLIIWRKFHNRMLHQQDKRIDTKTEMPNERVWQKTKAVEGKSRLKNTENTRRKRRKPRDKRTEWDCKKATNSYRLSKTKNTHRKSKRGRECWKFRV